MKKTISVALLLCMSIPMLSQNLGLKRNIERSNDSIFLCENGHRFLIDSTRVLSRFKPDVKKASLDVRYKLFNNLDIMEIEIPQNIKIEDYVKYLEQTDYFDKIEFNCFYSPSIISNDTYVNDQWYLSKIKVYDSWNISTGSSSVKVGVIDNGVDATHNDIGIGTDNYSNINISGGYDFISNTTYSPPVGSHGTMCAGIIGAKTNNSIGISGICGGNNSAGIEMVSYRTDYSAAMVISSINHAIGNGVKVLNMSLEGPYNYYLSNAMDIAHNNGISMVCSTGNSGISSIAFPASHQYSIAVGSSGGEDSRSFFSNYGPGIDIVAPGENIKSTSLNNSYSTSSGTSFSTSQVTGTIALMLSVNPSLTPIEIRNILHDTAYKKPTYSFDSWGWNGEIGYGILNCRLAVETVLFPQLEILGPSTICDSESYSIANLPPNVSITWSLKNNPYNYNIILQQNYPTGNQCTINIEDNLSLNDTLIASIVGISGNNAILKKKIQTGWNFTGSYSIFSSNNILLGTYSFTNNELIGLRAGERATLSSPYFDDAAITHTTNPNFFWMGNFITNDIEVWFNSYTQPCPSITVHGVNPSPCDNFTFYITQLHSLDFSPLLQIEGHQINISLNQHNVDHAKENNLSWSIQVLNIVTGENVYEGIIENYKDVLDTTQWKPGIYLIRSRIGEAVVVQKVVVK